MTVEQIRKFHSAQPFQPFEIYIADGRSIRVTHRELLALPPRAARTFAVWVDDGFEVIDLLLVTSLRPLRSSSGRRRSA
jgi:hypothetical protein